MFFGHGIEKDPFSRAGLNSISFGPSRRPSGVILQHYRERFCYTISIILSECTFSSLKNGCQKFFAMKMSFYVGGKVNLPPRRCGPFLRMPKQQFQEKVRTPLSNCEYPLLGVVRYVREENNAHNLSKCRPRATTQH